ncbi:MAG TPA: hypothetical protein VGH38_10795, partial [Bryobacteraceae bacterium]
LNVRYRSQNGKEVTNSVKATTHRDFKPGDSITVMANPHGGLDADLLTEELIGLAVVFTCFAGTGWFFTYHAVNLLRRSPV